MSALDLNKPFIIAGPCMLESPELGQKVAQHMISVCKQNNLHYIFKSSYDKANRTSGTSERGPGKSMGLQWLAALKAQFQVPILTDVHSPLQATEAAHVADILQIPAFLSEETDLLKACGRTGKIIQIKRGQHTSYESTVTAAKVVMDSGARDVLLCERGAAYGYNNLVVDYRSLIHWKSLGLRPVFDVTHSVMLPGAANGKSAGMREFTLGLARAAAAVGVGGLFLEVHCDPDNALSDRETQLNFSQAESLVASCAALLKSELVLIPG